VDLVDCLSADQFEHDRTVKLMRGEVVEENCSNFVFACRNPHTLMMPQKFSGQHKIYRMESKMLDRIQKGRVAVDLSWRKAPGS